MRHLLTRFLAAITLVAGVAVFGPAGPVRLAAAPPALDITIAGATTFAAANALPGEDSPGDPTTFTVSGNLTITSTGSITCYDSGDSGASGCPMSIVVHGNLVMEAGSKITADNQNDGGNGGNITITVGTAMTMCGPNGGQPGCASGTGQPGAVIAARKMDGAGDTGVGGDITITVGNIATVTGDFYMEGGVKTYGAETGAKILTSGTGPAGDITITSGRTYFTEPGAVVEAGGVAVPPSAIGQGGKIYLVSGCGFTTEGRITSKGPDPGADLVHLESCEVIVRGLVESTGKGHTINNDFGFVPPHVPNPAAPGPPYNSCDNNNDSLTNEVIHTDKTYNATGCIEVWGKVVTIDATNGWAGELNADIGNGGASGTGWIDIFAFSTLTVTDGTGNDRLSDNLGHEYFSTYAVHANTVDGSDGTPGKVTAKVKNGPLTASGKAFEASATMNNITGHDDGNINHYFVGNGSDGGTIDVQALGAVTLDDAWINAAGDFVGTPPLGGHIIVNAWGTASPINWREVDGDVQPNGTGTIALGACGAIDTAGTDFHGETPATSTGGTNCDATKPDLPAYVVFNFDAWTLCGGSTISGIKFNDLNGNHVNDGEPGLGGWVIHLYGTDVNGNPVHLTQTTAAGSGAYTFTGVPAGTYTICEQMVSASPAWQQTFPTSGVTCTTAADPDNLTPGKWGYTVDLTVGACCTGQEVAGKNFGNWQQPTLTCQKPTAIAIMNEAFPGNGGPDFTVKTWLGESVQAVVDSATDLNGDHFVIIMVIAHADGSLGGTANQKVAVSKDYTAVPASNYPFGLIGCSVTLTGGGAGPAVWIQGTAKSKQTTVNGRPTTILVADLHGGNSAVGVEADGTLRYLRNEAATGNGTGIKVLGGNNTVHNGAANGNTGDGVCVSGNSNYLTDTNSMSNGGNGFNIAGNSNQLLKFDAGEKGTPNTLDGVHVVGNSNTLKEIDAFNNGGDGIDVAGTGNTLNKNVAGDKGKGNKGIGIRVSGGSSLTENKAIGNLGDGFSLLTSGFSLSKNVAGGTSSGQPNGGCQYRFAVVGNVNAGSNKSNNVTLAGTPFPAGCK